ncbi:MAG TPA: bifunctional ornithine acetyltransferase/N-acetylglutamate synthase, partial [Polyangia bacterium]
MKTTDKTNATGAKTFAPPIGFRFGAVAAGVKEAGGARKDVALVASEIPCSAAGVLTVNKLCAAPVSYTATRLPTSGIRAIVANSGNANALTGPVGAADERAVAAAVAQALGVGADDVLTASTGGIGIRLPAERIAAAAPAL